MTKMKKKKKKKKTSWIVIKITNKSRHSVIMMLYCSHFLILMRFEIFWLWKSISSILKNIKENPNDKLDSLFFFREFINIKQMYNKIFVFSKVDNLIFDFILFMIVLILNNNVFESNIKSIKNIFRIKIHLLC